MQDQVSTHGNVVLLVEDEFLVREFTADILEEGGFGVVQARDADEALAVLADHPEVKVLFTDVNMPGSIDGVQLAHEVAGRYPHVARMVTSGRGQPPSAPDDYRFLPKPYSPSEVIRSIREMLAERGPMRRNEGLPRRRLS